MKNNQYYYKIIVDYEEEIPGYLIETNIPYFSEKERNSLEKLTREVIDNLNETKHMEPLSVEIRFLDVFNKND
jgi:hypothetical protein